MIRRPPRSTLFPSPPLFRSPPADPPVGGDRNLAERVLAAPRTRQAPGVSLEPERALAPEDPHLARRRQGRDRAEAKVDRKSTRLNSSHGYISYAVFCLKKKK